MCAATEPAASGSGRARGALLPQFFESVQALLGELALGLDAGMLWLTSPSGVRLLVQGAARPGDLEAIRTAVATAPLP